MQKHVGRGRVQRKNRCLITRARREMLVLLRMLLLFVYMSNAVKLDRLIVARCARCSLVFPTRHAGLPWAVSRLNRGSQGPRIRAGRGRLKQTTGTPGSGALCPKGAGGPSI